MIYMGTLTTFQNRLIYKKKKGEEKKLFITFNAFHIELIRFFLMSLIIIIKNIYILNVSRNSWMSLPIKNQYKCLK